MKMLKTEPHASELRQHKDRNNIVQSICVE
jgi:hypothetical protein